MHSREKEYSAFAEDLNDNRKAVKERRNAVRARYGKAVSPNRLKVLRMQAKERKKALKEEKS